MKYLTGIADFLGTTKSYLLNGGNAEIVTEADLSDDEKDFLRKFRAIGEYERKSITEIADRFYDLRGLKNEQNRMERTLRGRANAGETA